MNNRLRKLIIIGIYFILVMFVVVHLVFYFINKAAVVSFKNLHSAYSQALEITVDDMLGDTGCYFSSSKKIKSDFSGCDRFYKNFATNLRVTKYCKQNALVNGCIPEYSNYAITPECAGFSESMFNRYNQAFVMGDKSILSIFNMPANVQRPLFAVDSNGMLPPNKSGYDLFSLVIMRGKNGEYYFHSNVTYCLPLEKGGIHSLQDVYME